MAKRKAPASSAKNLRLYQKSYKGGARKDSHFVVFEEARKLIGVGATKVLYPGCHRHLTASLVFPSLTYIDCDAKVGPLYEEPAAVQYVGDIKIYEEESSMEFFCADVNNGKKEPMKSLDKDYDLLISLSAGLLAEPCTPHIKTGGWLLVNDSHSDASSVFVNCKDDWELKAYWDDEHSQFAVDEMSLSRCFLAIDKKTKGEAALTRAQLQECISVGAISKRSFRMPFAPMFYLFQRK